jgi:hypothetical protein
MICRGKEIVFAKPSGRGRAPLSKNITRPKNSQVHAKVMTKNLSGNLAPTIQPLSAAI